jgi:hypothetical protein
MLIHEHAVAINDVDFPMLIKYFSNLAKRNGEKIVIGA